MSKPSRRQFIATSAAVASVATVPALIEAAEPRPAQQQPERDPFGGFTVGIQSYSYRQLSLERALEQIQGLGLRNVELYRGHVPLAATEAQIRAVRNLLEKHRITPVAFGVERFTKDHAANRRLFEFARRLGVRFLTADPDPESFDSLDQLVVEFGIGIAIHPHGPVGQQLHRWYSAEEIMKTIRERTLIGACLDTGHLIRSAQNPFNRNLDPAQQIRRMGARNFGMHLKDHDNKTRTDVVFGRGVLNVGNVLRALREVRFGGYIAIEYEANPANPTPDIRACLDVFREAVRKL
ncbi:MAG: sugar phosphate isomerase/epimerase [Planctomycetes bacterium]|nr:sugar phosphate isomerase/epimerase [Planctomycetota bacterium]